MLHQVNGFVFFRIQNVLKGCPSIFKSLAKPGQNSITSVRLKSRCVFSTRPVPRTEKQYGLSLREFLVPKLLLQEIRCGFKQKFSGSKKIEQYFVKDGISPRYELIYNSDFTTYFLWLQVGICLLAASTFITFFMFIAERYILERSPVKKDSRPFHQQILEDQDKDKSSENRAEIYKKAKEEVDIPLLFGDVDEEEEYALYSFIAIFCCFLYWAARFMRLMPVRVYISPSDHCVGVFMSSIVPTKTSLRQFVAGTLRYASENEKLPMARTTFIDPGGNQYVFLPRYFRTPADFHHLLDPETVIRE